MQGFATVNMPPAEDDLLLKIAESREFNPGDALLKRAVKMAQHNPGGMSVIVGFYKLLQAKGETADFEAWLDLFEKHGMTGAGLWVVFKDGFKQSVEGIYERFQKEIY